MMTNLILRSALIGLLVLIAVPAHAQVGTCGGQYKQSFNCPSASYVNSTCSASNRVGSGGFSTVGDCPRGSGDYYSVESQYCYADNTCTNPLPTITFSSNPSSIYNGDASSLSWSTSNAVSCTGDTNFSTGNAAQSSGVYVRPQNSTTYTLTCANSVGGTSSATATVSVSPQPFTASCTPNRTNARIGDAVTWNASAANGLAPYSFSWGGELLQGLVGTSQTVTYSSAGQKTGIITGTDSYRQGAGYNPSYADAQRCTGALVTNVGGHTEDLGPWPNHYQVLKRDMRDALNGRDGLGSRDPNVPQDVINNPQNYCVEGELWDRCNPDNYASGFGACPVEYYVSIHQGTGTRPLQSSDNGLTYRDCGDYQCSSWTQTVYFGTLTGTYSQGVPHTSTNQCTATVNVAADAPTVTFSASPVSVISGQASQLTWSSTNATSCTSSSFATGNATSGNTTVTPGSTTTYSITCSGAGGSNTASATVSVTPTLAASCSVSPSSIAAGGSATWAATPSGGSGLYSYSWTGSDGLTGSTQSIAKTYSSAGTKTASVTVTSGSQQVTVPCSNNLTVTAPPPPPASITATCNAGGTSVTLSWPSVPSATNYYPRINGNPIQPGCGQAGWQVWTDNTTCYPNPDSWTQTSATLPVNPGQAYSAWVHSGNANGIDWNNPPSTNFTCTAALADLTAGSVSPSSATAGQAVTFSASASNTGSGNSGAFPVRFQIDDNSLTTNIANPVSSYISLTAGASSAVSAPYTFGSAGTYQVRACANQNSAGTNIVSESNYGNNCGSWTPVVVGSAAQSLTCSVSNTSPNIGQQVTYTANNGSAGFPYAWSASDGWAGTNGVTASTINRTFNTPGSYGMQVTDNGSTAQCQIVTAGNVGMCMNPNATITANPSRVRSGSTSTLTWSASGVSTCTVTGPGVNQTVFANSCNVSPSSVTTPPITAQSVYTISCDGGTTTKQVIVNVLVAPVEF